VLGLLPEDESSKVERLVELFPELREERDRIGETLEAVALETALVPAPSVKERLFTSLAELRIAADRPGNEEQNFLSPNQDGNGSPARVISMNMKRFNTLVAAVLIGLVLSVGAIVILVMQNQESRREIAALEQRVNTGNQSISRLQQQNLAYDQLIRIMQDKNYTGIDLQQVPGKPVATAKVFWNRNTGEVYLVDVSLPQVPADKQYQLWAIVDGKPVSAGMLTDRKQQAQRMQTFEKADAFAITLEKRGGSAQPTLEEMYVMGKAS
jgi:hypothetical protein